MQDFDNLRPGDALHPLVVGPVTRRDLALFAGASGDHNPLHIDADAARAAGLPDVFAQGMFVGGLVAQTLWNWLGEEGRLRRCRMRIVAPTFRDETLRMTSVCTAAAGSTAELEAVVEKPSGLVVLRAWATIAG